jgi:hypothetical protein
MPKLITINDIKEGMELAVPVRNKFSQVLLAEDIKLEERHIKILSLWGIQSIYIKDTEEEKEVQYDESVILKAKEELKKRLTWNFRNPSEEEIYNLALNELLVKKMK